MSELTVHILQKELARRCGVNSRYSLRAFARLLDISPASLSLVLNRKRLASRKLILRVLEHIEIEKRDRAILLGQNAIESLPVDDSAPLEKLENVMNLISYAILSLTFTKGFKSDAKWIAGRLGFSVHEIRAALQALVKAQLLDMSKRTWVQLDPIRINNKVSTSITRKFQRELIERALSSLEELPMDERDLSSITFAMSRDQMPKAKAEIRKFRLRMAELFEEKNQSTDVYNLTVQLIPLTKEITK